MAQTVTHSTQCERAIPGTATEEEGTLRCLRGSVTADRNSKYRYPAVT